MGVFIPRGKSALRHFGTDQRCRIDAPVGGTRGGSYRRDHQRGSKPHAGNLGAQAALTAHVVLRRRAWSATAGLAQSYPTLPVRIGDQPLVGTTNKFHRDFVLAVYVDSSTRAVDYSRVEYRVAEARNTNKEAMAMRAVIALTLTLLGALLLSATEPAQAQCGTWCLRGEEGTSCSYNTLKQCQAARSGATIGSCGRRRNPLPKYCNTRK